MISMRKGSSKLLNLVMMRDWDAVVERCKSHPQEAKRWSKVHFDGPTSRLLPLHQVCALEPPSCVVVALLQAYPKAALQKESLRRRTPLHIACLKNASVDVVRTLVVTYSNLGCSEIRDASDSLPLHYAVLTRCPIETVKMLLWAYPEGARDVDKEGNLPIQIAWRFNAAQEVVQELAKACPEAVYKEGLTQAVGVPDFEVPRTVVSTQELIPLP